MRRDALLSTTTRACWPRAAAFIEKRGAPDENTSRPDGAPSSGAANVSPMNPPRTVTRARTISASRAAAHAGQVVGECRPLFGRPASQQLGGRGQERLIERGDLGRPVRVDAYDDPPPVVRVGLAPNDPSSLEAVEDARDRAAREPGQLGEPGRGDLGFADGELETLEVGGIDPEALGDGFVEDKGSGHDPPPQLPRIAGIGP